MNHDSFCFLIFGKITVVGQGMSVPPLVSLGFSDLFITRSRIVSPTYGGTVHFGLEPMTNMLLSRTSWLLPVFFICLNDSSLFRAVLIFQSIDQNNSLIRRAMSIVTHLWISSRTTNGIGLLLDTASLLLCRTPKRRHFPSMFSLHAQQQQRVVRGTFHRLVSLWGNLFHKLRCGEMMVMLSRWGVRGGCFFGW